MSRTIRNKPIPLVVCHSSNTSKEFSCQVNIIWLSQLTRLNNFFSMCSLKPIKAHYTNYVISKDYTDQVDGLWNEFVFRKMYGMDLSAHIPNSKFELGHRTVLNLLGYDMWSICTLSLNFQIFLMIFLGQTRSHNFRRSGLNGIDY